MRSLMPDLKHRGSRPRLALSPVALLTCALLQSLSSHAQQAVEDSPVRLKSSPLLQEKIPQSVRSSLPTFLFGEQIYGRPDLETTSEGQAEMRRGDMVIRADRLDYDQPTDLAKARGHVHVNRAGNVYEGPLLELKVDSFEGFFNDPNYQFLKNEGHGEAKRADFLDENRVVVHKATFTTCRRLPGPSWLPDWILRASVIRMDNEEDVGEAEGALLSFKGVPLLPIPYLSFPLSDKRKSGFLPPTVGVDNVKGLEVQQPYYWNIAPNRDATLFPTLMSKRGVDLGAEFRYLESGYSGRLSGNYMPNDKLREQDRWGLSYQHLGSINTGLAAVGGVGLNLNLNRVSDSNYWRDFTPLNPALSQRLLPNDASLSWGRGEWTTSVRAVKWQTLQDVAAPITPPYDRWPQLAARFSRPNVGGVDVVFNADYTQFQADRLLTGQPNSQRVFTQLQLSRPWRAPGGYITPKLQLHATSYQFDGPLVNGASEASRVVPTISLDSGLVFERDASFFGRDFLQTLEPRAFYVKTPYRDQSFLPNYDSGASDFNFATIYTENAFVGNDRISDSNLMTLGVTSRLLNPDTGAESVRLGMAQRLRFQDQLVTLPGGLPVQDRVSDLLLGGAINWTPKWALESIVQFNPKTEESVRSTVGARYSPGNYRTVTAAYRFQRDVSEQIDISWQWPLNDLWGDRGQELGPGRGQGDGRWYSVGRLNYSVPTASMVNAVLGFEYDAGCWLGRIVLELQQTSLTTANQRIMFQLEFVGFSRLGVSPLRTLKTNIPRYQNLREEGSPSSRFSNYD
jgi:LPS-assembly protein